MYVSRRLGRGGGGGGERRNDGADGGGGASGGCVTAEDGEVGEVGRWWYAGAVEIVVVWENAVPVLEGDMSGKGEGRPATTS